ncbi:hypothetical protein BS78_09G081200 [Paspalum vaginatum]|nr:hypothetical protein BS78_09G081200 [Paspalum vaginatum]
MSTIIQTTPIYSINPHHDQCRQCRANLFKKHVVDDAAWELCHQGPETTEHFFECRFAAQFWASLGLQIRAGFRANDLHCISRPASIPDTEFSSYILLCCWQIWKRRNNHVFRGDTANLQQVVRACREEATSWAYRLRRDIVWVANVWCSSFAM